MATRTVLIGTLTAALLGGGAFVSVAGPATAAPPEGPDDRSSASPQPRKLLDRTLPGPAAKRRLGVQGLQRAAEVNDLAASRVQELLADRTTRLTADGRLYYADVAEAETTAPAEATAPLAASYPLSQTFSLHSRPSSKRTIHLDFDGASVSGTWWNESWGGSLPASNVVAFSLDGDRSSFNDNERRLIQEIWARVSEDFAPFDVDVTTATPAAGDLTRSSSSDQTYGTQVLFAPGKAVASALCSSGCSGVAWVDVFDRAVGSAVPGPAWVFTDVAGTAGYRLTEVASHEAGHTLSLQHDGTTTSSYYTGRSPWGPIMGSSRYALSQWSNGDYAGANQQQDDFAAISTSGAPALADDHADALGSATPLVSQAHGIIGDRDDQDVFRIDHGSCSPTITVRAAEVGANLDARLRVLDASGQQVASANPTLSQTAYGELGGTGASISLPRRSAGTLYAEVDGVGQGSLYSDYGSAGRYSVTLTGCGVDDPTGSTDSGDTRTGVTSVAERPEQVGIGRAYPGPRGGVRTAKGTWEAPSAGTETLNGYRVLALKVRRSGKVIRRFGWTVPASALDWAPRLPRGRYQFQVAAINDAGRGPMSARSNRVRAR